MQLAPPRGGRACLGHRRCRDVCSQRPPPRPDGTHWGEDRSGTHGLCRATVGRVEVGGGSWWRRTRTRTGMMVVVGSLSVCGPAGCSWLLAAPDERREEREEDDAHADDRVRPPTTRCHGPWSQTARNLFVAGPVACARRASGPQTTALYVFHIDTSHML